MGFDNVVSIEVGHLSTSLHPDFILAILGKVVKATDVESEFAAFGKFTDEQSSGEQLVLGNVGGHVGNDPIDVEHSVSDESEH